MSNYLCFEVDLQQFIQIIEDDLVILVDELCRGDPTGVRISCGISLPDAISVFKQLHCSVLLFVLNYSL